MYTSKKTEMEISYEKKLDQFNSLKGDENLPRVISLLPSTTFASYEHLLEWYVYQCWTVIVVDANHECSQLEQFETNIQNGDAPYCVVVKFDPSDKNKLIDLVNDIKEFTKEEIKCFREENPSEFIETYDSLSDGEEDVENGGLKGEGLWKLNPNMIGMCVCGAFT